MLHIKRLRFIMFKKTSSQTGKRRLPVSSFYLSSGNTEERSGHLCLMEMKLDFFGWFSVMLYCKFLSGFPLFLMFLFQLLATLPDDVQPGPDFYGLPWKPVLITASLGIVSFAVFFWRTVLVVSKLIYTFRLIKTGISLALLLFF